MILEGWCSSQKYDCDIEVIHIDHNTCLCMPCLPVNLNVSWNLHSSLICDYTIDSWNSVQCLCLQQANGPAQSLPSCPASHCWVSAIISGLLHTSWADSHRWISLCHRQRTGGGLGRGMQMSRIKARYAFWVCPHTDWPLMESVLIRVFILWKL